MKKKRINVVSLGCSKNLVDAEMLMGQLHANNLEVVYENKYSHGDVVLINTCGFIKDAKEESIDAVLNAVAAKSEGIVDKVFVMGCLTQRYRSDILQSIPEVDGVYGVNQLPEIIKTLGGDFRKELYGERFLTTPAHFAFLKVAEGCDRTCSFCAIPLIRGKHISRSIEGLVEEAVKLSEKGVKELILIAQDLSYYGLDLYKKKMLALLLEKLSEINGIEWIRLQYLYPAGFPMEVMEMMQSSEKICKYIDIPLQHISDSMLKSMHRNNTKAETYRLIEDFRKHVPEAALRTTLIVGYPGETKAQFEELKQFVAEIRFDRMGVFTYSPEEDTAAFQLKDNILQKVKNERAAELMNLQQEISLSLNREKIGKMFKVLFDRVEGDYFIGRTEFDSPEVDNEVLVNKKDTNIVTGSFYPIRITSAEEFDLYGEVAR